jgi:hypothetical protein
VAALVFPVYRVGVPAEISVCSPAEAALELLRHAWNFATHREAAVRRVSELVRALPAVRLSFFDADAAADVVADALDDGRHG